MVASRRYIAAISESRGCRPGSDLRQLSSMVGRMVFWSAFPHRYLCFLLFLASSAFTVAKTLCDFARISYRYRVVVCVDSGDRSFLLFIPMGGYSSPHRYADRTHMGLERYADIAQYKGRNRC